MITLHNLRLSFKGKIKRFQKFGIFVQISSGAIIILILIVMLLFQTNRFRSNAESVKDSLQHNNFPLVAWQIPIPEHADFAGEFLPLYNFDVYESLDREMMVNVFWQSQTMLMIKRATRYFPVIEEILKKNGIPDDFKYVAVIESGLSHPTSPSEAKGIWQFIESTAKEYKLEVNKEVDERYDIEKSTQAACNFFNDSYKLYKNWTLAAASYNVGRARITKELSRQNAKNYYDLILNDETSRYIYRIVSMKTIMKNPEKYGYQFDKINAYPFIPFTEVVIDSSVNDFAAFAEKYSVNYKIFKMFNPWLRESFLTNKDKKSYTVKFPKEGYRVYENNQ